MLAMSDDAMAGITFLGICALALVGFIAWLYFNGRPDRPVIERVRTIYPVRSLLQRAALIAWRVTVAAALGYLGWCRWRGK